MEGHSPTPWRVKWNRELSNWLVVRPDGNVVCAAWREEDAAFIADAVNLKDRIDKAMKGEDGFDHLVALDGRPCVFVTPPPSEAELARWIRDESAAHMTDRAMLERSRAAAFEEIGRLRDLVRRLVSSLSIHNTSAMLAVVSNREEFDTPDFREAINADAALLREAREAIGEGKP